MFCLLRTKDSISLCNSCNYCFNYVLSVTYSQINNYQAIKERFDSAYDHWEGERFAILSDGESIIIEKMYPCFHHVGRWIIRDESRVQSILRKLVKFKQSPDDIVTELRTELASLIIQLPWEIIEGRELMPRDKDLQKFLRKANALAKGSNGLLTTRNRAKADFYLGVLAGIVACSVRVEDRNFQLIKTYEQPIKERVHDLITQ